MIAGSVGLVFGAHWVYKGTMLPGDFFTLLILLGATADSIRKMSDVWNKIQQANAAAERVYAVIDQKPEVESPDAFELEPLKIDEFLAAFFRENHSSCPPSLLGSFARHSSAFSGLSQAS